MEEIGYVYVEFGYVRDIMRGGNFKPGIKEIFPSIKFEGTETGNYVPMVSIDEYEFIKNLDKFKSSHFAKKAISIRGVFTPLTKSAFGVRDFHHKISYKDV